ncbi:MAG TPA: pyridoxal-phosphate dependent enzyme, partial [Spirochaetia bacterium]|nr:pyridoxal-phosphate dependent enzyme [Spirochaetia bacterium]
SLPGFAAEGGAKNVARRDGMATTVLSAVDVIGEIPAHYFQAVGSGTGAIAAWEANLRLIESGQYGDRKMRLHVSQNAPFTPIHDSWQIRSRNLVDMDENDARERVSRIDAKVLANRKPPYSLRGGLFDALSDTDGTTGVVDNDTASAAASLFERLEGIDVAPAAAVAVAHLLAAVKNGLVGADEPIMLNITGGGYRRVREDLDVRECAATRVIERDQFAPDSVAEIVGDLF